MDNQKHPEYVGLLIHHCSSQITLGELQQERGAKYYQVNISKAFISQFLVPRRNKIKG